MVLRPDAGEQDALHTSFGQRLQSFLSQLPDAETRFPEHEECSELRAELYRLKKETGEVLQEITNMKLDLRRKDATILELGRQAGALKSSNAWRSVRRASLVDEARKSAKLRSFKDWPRTKPEKPLTRGGPGEVTTCSGSQSPLCKLQTTRSGKSMLSSTRAPTTLRPHANLLRARNTSTDSCAAAHFDGQAPGSPSRTRRPAPEPGEDGSAKLPGPTARVCIQRLRDSRLLRPVRLSPAQAASATALRACGLRGGRTAAQAEAHPRPSPPRELPACEHAEDAGCRAKNVTQQMLRPHPEESEGGTSTSCSEEDSETDEVHCSRHCSHQAKPQHEYLLKLDLTLVSKHMATSVLEGMEASATVPQTPRGRPPVAWWCSSEVTAPASARGRAPGPNGPGPVDGPGSRRRESRSLYVLEMVTPRTAVTLHPNLEVAEVESPLLLLRPPCDDTPKEGGGGRPSLGNISTSSDEDDIRSRLNKDIAKRGVSPEDQFQGTVEDPTHEATSPSRDVTLAHVLTTQVPTPARSSLKSVSAEMNSSETKPVEA
ncbi:SNW1 [Symbiodinium sp. CCMP2456]|nr:SNW1 [Symbiodinium sp. CCMP2456]